jgi:hypothetical protein
VGSEGSEDDGVSVVSKRASGSKFGNRAETGVRKWALEIRRGAIAEAADRDRMRQGVGQ